ncbi:hypothetical protein D3C75_863240 [compost metagenome]
MSIAEEVTGIGELIRLKFPDSQVHRFQEPDLPMAREFAIQLKQEIRRSEARSHTVIERQYRIHYYSELAEEAVVSMGAFSRYVMNETASIPVMDATGIVRPESFTIDIPEKLESGLLRCSGTMVVFSREAVVMAEYQKIDKVEMRTTIN